MENKQTVSSLKGYSFKSLRRIVASLGEQLFSIHYCAKVTIYDSDIMLCYAVDNNRSLNKQTHHGA